MSDTLVTLKDVGLTYKTRAGFFGHRYYRALEAVSFEIRKHETLGIIGRNGCGKSTLMRIIAGILYPDYGHIERNNNRISLLSRSVGFDPELDGRANIVLSAMLLGASRREAEDNTDAIIEFSELNHFIDEPVKTYSAGMRLRLGFSIATTIVPDVVLIDEALGGGDSHFRRKAETYITEKARSRQTVVLVSHNSGQIERLCDRAVWLDEGVVVKEGDPAYVLKQYEEFAMSHGGVGNASEKAGGHPR